MKVRELPVTTLREDLEHAIELMLARRPPPPCGSECRPHMHRPAGPGALVRCVSCAELLVLGPAGRARVARLDDLDPRRR